MIILDVLKSLNVLLSNSVMTETCSRQTTACSRPDCSSCSKLSYLLIYNKEMKSPVEFDRFKCFGSLDVIIHDFGTGYLVADRLQLVAVVTDGVRIIFDMLQLRWISS